MVEEEKAIVRFCLTLDNWGHPLKLSMIKDFATALLPSENHREISRRWVNRFLSRNLDLVSTVKGHTSVTQGGSFSSAIAEGSLAEGVLKDEMIKTIRLNSKGPPVKALKDRRTLTKARVIDQHEVVALREARNARVAEKLRKVTR